MLQGAGSPLTDFDAAGLRGAVTRDRELLVAFAIEAETVSSENDPKLPKLTEELAEIGTSCCGGIWVG